MIVNLAVDALATFRLVRLATEDRVTAKLRRKVAARGSTAEYFIGCPWCTSVYIAAGVVTARRMAPRAWAPVAEALAFSAVAGLIAEY